VHYATKAPPGRPLLNGASPLPARPFRLLRQCPPALSSLPIQFLRFGVSGRLSLPLAILGLFPEIIGLPRHWTSSRAYRQERWKPTYGSWLGEEGSTDSGNETIAIIARILVALLIGSLIGLERSFHGRPAGFRTHALVSIASALLMLVTVYQAEWMTAVTPEMIRTDPTRMAQGIITGIGFLGAGVIFKEGLTVRGLTTAASIWVTSAIGILVGIGFYFPAILVSLAVLGLFRLVERRMPSEFYAYHWIRFDRNAVKTDHDVRRLIGEHGFTVANVFLPTDRIRQSL
jgi:putative Mg2+ transporter-C (MgtC) family protein